MAKVADLRQAMSASAKIAPRRPPVVVEPAPKAPALSGGAENPHYRPGRANKSNVTGYFPGEVKKQLRLLAAERETTIQRLLAEALNDLFAKNGKPEIAPLEDH
jgi:hypothetical protein